MTLKEFLLRVRKLPSKLLSVLAPRIRSAIENLTGDPPTNEMIRAHVTALQTRAGFNLLRGVVPVPENWTETDLVLRDSQGNLLPTDQRVGKRFPNGKPMTLELRALYTTATGGAKVFTVEEGSLGSSLAHPAPINISLICRDHNNTLYTARVVSAEDCPAAENVVTSTKYKSGEFSSGSNARMMGYSAWITTIAGEPDVFLVEMTLNNGRVGVTPVLHDLFFDGVQIVLPAGWTITHERQDEYNTSTHLMKNMFEQTYNCVPQGQRKPYRFAIHRTDAAATGRAAILLSLSGFFMCNHSKTEWSWSNPTTAWFGPQCQLVPNINLSSYIHNHGGGAWTYQQLSAAMASGQALNGDYLAGGKGPYYPSGTVYHGAAGGVGITGYLGYELVNSPTTNNLKLYMAYLSTIMDRQQGVCITGADQLPIEPSEWDYSSVTLGDGPGQFLNDGPFGRLAADQWRFNEVSAQGKLPWYYQQHKDYLSYKFSHMVRGMSTAFPLATLLNDPIAKVHIEELAVWCRMLLREYSNGELQQGFNTSQSFPGKGAIGSRYYGWPILCTAAHWQFADDTYRAGCANWISMVVNTREDAQMPCGGWHADENGAVAGLLDAYGTIIGIGPVDAAGAQSIEEGIGSHSLSALYACLSGTEKTRLGALFQPLANGTWNYAWKPGWDAPHSTYPVRQQDKAGVAWASQSAAPPVFSGNIVGNGCPCVDNYQIAVIPVLALQQNPTNSSAWQIIGALSGEGDPASALADLAGQMPNKMAEGWGALVAYLQDYTTSVPLSSGGGNPGDALNDALGNMTPTQQTILTQSIQAGLGRLSGSGR